MLCRRSQKSAKVTLIDPENDGVGFNQVQRKMLRHYGKCRIKYFLEPYLYSFEFTIFHCILKASAVLFTHNTTII